MLLALLRYVIFRIRVARQESARARNGETFVVKETFDLENGFDVFAAIEAVTAETFHRLQRGKFGFPVTEDESFGRSEAADFADAEKRFFRE